MSGTAQQRQSTELTILLIRKANDCNPQQGIVNYDTAKAYVSCDSSTPNLGETTLEVPAEKPVQHIKPPAGTSKFQFQHN
jgi:hypothetical protein